MVVYDTFTTALSGNGFVSTKRCVEPSAVNPSAKYQVLEVCETHCEVTSPAAYINSCSTEPNEPIISTTGTTTPTVLPRSTSTSFRERATTVIVSASAGASLR